MAENRHIQHLRSKVVESNGKPKLPASSALTFGEIAVNYADNVETLSIKNENGNIVVFSSDDYYTKEKLGTAFTGSNSAFTVTEGLDEKVNNDELDDKIADAIATADTVSGAIETIVNDKLAAFSSATEIEEALSGKSDVGHHHVVADIDDFDDGVENVVSLSETITERIENVVASAITNNESVSASVSTIVEDKLTAYSSATEIDAELLKYAKKGQVDKVSEFINDVSYVTSGQVEPMVAAAISGSDAVISAITEILSDNSGITEVINNVVSEQIEGAVSGKADSDDVQEWIEAATSGKVDTTAFTAFTSSTETTLGNKADSSAVTESIEAATSGKVDTSVYEQFTGDTETALGNKVSNDTYTAYTAATEAVLSGKADVSDLSNYFDSVDYTTSGDSHVIKFYHGETLIDYINADDFIKDGMVDNVEIADVSGVTSLIIAFNEDGGKERIVIPISDIFDASNYYTIDETDLKFLTQSGASNTYLTKEEASNTYVSNANFNVTVESAITNSNDIKNDIISAVTNSDEFTGLTSAVNTHTADTTIHVTSSDKSSWNAKLDASALNGYATEAYVQSAITEAGGVTTGTVQTMIDSSISGKSDIGHTHYASAITDFDDAVADGISGNTAIINAISKSIEVNPTFSGSIINAVTNSTEYQTLSGDVYSISGDVYNISESLNNLGSAAFKDEEYFALSSHTHDANDIEDLNIAIANYVSGDTNVINSITKVITGNSSVSGSVIDIVSDYTYDKATIDNKISGGGTFDPTQYYTTAQTDNLLDGKSSTGHTHATTIATSTATNQINLDFGSKYALSAGGTSYVFTMPSTSSTWTNNYYTTGLTVSTATTSNTITVKGNNTSVTGTAVLNGATTSAAGLMTSADKTALNNLNPLSGKVSTLSAITATSTAINSLTGSVGTMAYKNATDYYTKADLTGSSTTVVVTKASSAATAASANSVALSSVTNADDLKVIEALTGTSGLLKKTAANSWSLDTTSYSSATQVNTALGNKQDSLTFDGTYSASNNKVATVSTVTNAINALDGGTIGASSASKTITSLSQTNGNVSATFEDIAITSSQVTNFTSAVSDVVATAITANSSVSGAITTAINNNANVTYAKSFADFCSGHNIVTSLTDIPATKRLVIANISSSQNNISVSGGVSSLSNGYELHIIVNNGSGGSVTIAVADLSSPYKVVGNDINIPASTYGEINIISDGTNLYVRGA